MINLAPGQVGLAAAPCQGGGQLVLRFDEEPGRPARSGDAHGIFKGFDRRVQLIQVTRRLAKVKLHGSEIVRHLGAGDHVLTVVCR